MRRRDLGYLATLAAFSVSTGIATAACQLQQIGTLPVDMQGLRPLVWTKLSDTEYDLANGMVRFFKPTGCGHQPLAYWATTTPYTSVDLEPIDVSHDHLATTAMVNGKRIRVIFDSGAPGSYLSVSAAARAGITPDSAGVTYLGLGGGLGPQSNKVWSAPVDSFQLGGEKVQHTHLLIGELDPAHQAGQVDDDMPDMLLGEDFFLSHRIFVAYSQRKLYFTYNGGPLFDLHLPNATVQEAATTVEQPYASTPTDADGFRRQGMAYAAMQQYDLALSDLTRACDLAPKDADAHYDRGLIYGIKGQFQLELQEFTAALALQPDDIDARLARAALLKSHPDVDKTASVDIKSDLDLVSRLSSPAAPVRMALADEYSDAGYYEAAMNQLGQWLSHHRLPGDQISGLNDRCWTRASANRDLALALSDCNHALGPDYDDAAIRDSRGLVYLRLNRLEDAMADYNFALHANPDMPTSL